MMPFSPFYFPYLNSKQAYPNSHNSNYSTHNNTKFSNFPSTPYVKNNITSNNIHSTFGKAYTDKPVSSPCKTDNKNSSNYDDFFEIFGIKLYFDDLLILALLFFLYKEDVNDIYLYVILVMLLLT